MLFLVVYFGLIATDMYVSEARFSLRSAERGSGAEWLSLFGQATGSTGADAYVVQDYIQSYALLADLDKELNLKDHYQNQDADFISRLKQSPTREEFVDYFAKQVTINYDQVAGIIRVKVRAFSPEFAQMVCQGILDRSEDLVNRMRERSIKDSLALTRDEVARAEQRLAAVRQKMREFREVNNLLDPHAQAGSVQGLVAEFEGTVAKARAELAEARSYMQDDSARIVALKARIAAMESQIVAEKKRLTGKDQTTMNSLAAEYEQLKIEHEFAQKQLLSSMTSLEAARISAERQSRYLVAFIKPTTPEEATWPRRWYSLAVSFAGLVLLYGLGSLIFAAVREHAGV